LNQMSIGNLFHRILTEWSYLEKQMITKGETFIRKAPSHEFTKNLNIDFSIRAFEKTEFKNKNMNIEPIELINYEQGATIVIINETLEPTEEQIVDGLTIKISNSVKNSKIVYFSAAKEKNPQFSLFISYLILYLNDRNFKQAYTDALHDLNDYWSTYTLSREIQVGLFGELYILEKVAKTIGWKKALNSWEGPDRGLHDFVFKNTLLEIKTTESDPPKIYVDNPEQFFIPLTKTLILNVCNICTGEGLDIRERMFELLGNISEEHKNIFREKLYDYGFFEKLLPTKLLKIKVINSQQVPINEENMSMSKNLIDDFPSSITK